MTVMEIIKICEDRYENLMLKINILHENMSMKT